MLPDFARPKTKALRDLLKVVTRQIPNVAPILRGIAKFRQHEGKSGALTRVDGSEGTIDYKPSEFTFTLTREEMKKLDIQAIHAKLFGLAKEMGEDQTRRMLELVKEAADSVGNVVNAGGELTQDKFLNIFRMVQMDFDPRTLQVKPGFSFVMHPDVAAKVVPKVNEWEKDPAFNAEYERIISDKREEWRAREARRKLVS